MTDKKEIKKYCSGIDCLTCGEPEPCIYRIANELQEQLNRKEEECEKLYIQLKTDEEYHKEEENTLRKIIKNKEERNIELYKENKKYKQALDEIEKYLDAQQKYFDGEDYHNLLDIIDKAKDSK